MRNGLSNNSESSRDGGLGAVRQTITLQIACRLEVNLTFIEDRVLIRLLMP